MVRPVAGGKGPDGIAETRSSTTGVSRTSSRSRDPLSFSQPNATTAPDGPGLQWVFEQDPNSTPPIRPPAATPYEAQEAPPNVNQTSDYPTGGLFNHGHGSGHFGIQPNIGPQAVGHVATNVQSANFDAGYKPNEALPKFDGDSAK